MIRITQYAWQMIMTAVKYRDLEVAWFAHAPFDAESQKFIIDDIVIPPQVVGGAHAEIEPEQLDWLMVHLLERGEQNITDWTRIFCHSHVNMSTTPSITDTDAQEELAAQSKDGYNIGIIFNTKGETTAWATYRSPLNNSFVTETLRVEVEPYADTAMKEAIHGAIEKRVERYKAPAKPAPIQSAQRPPQSYDRQQLPFRKEFADFAWERYVIEGWDALTATEADAVIGQLEDRRMRIMAGGDLVGDELSEIDNELYAAYGSLMEGM